MTFAFYDLETTGLSPAFDPKLAVDRCVEQGQITLVVGNLKPDPD